MKKWYIVLPLKLILAGVINQYFLSVIPNHPVLGYVLLGRNTVETKQVSSRVIVPGYVLLGRNTEATKQVSNRVIVPGYVFMTEEI